MIANPERWEGRVVEGKFRLARTLRGSEHGAVFLVEGQPQTVIRFVDAAAPEGRDQLARWEAAARLTHPNLIKILETGRCQVAGHDLFYLWTEYAEENLAQILPERALTADEASKVLDDVLAALAYVHAQGFVHGSLKPSNIFAVADTVKLSSDSVRAAGSAPERRSVPASYDAPEASVDAIAPSADIWSLGVTLVEVLTQHRIAVDWPRKQPALSNGIPQPFQEIVENCVQMDPSRRWTIAQIQTRLGGGKPGAVRPTSAVAPPAAAATRSSSSIPAEKKQSGKWPYAIALAVVIVLAVLLFPRQKPPVPEPAQTASESSASPASSGSTPAGSAGQVAQRVMPAISGSALNTIQGKIRIAVEVNVDEKGNVTEARMKSSGPSQFFARKVLEATQRWKFKPPVDNGQPVASRWLIRFTLTRRAVDDSAEQIKP